MIYHKIWAGVTGQRSRSNTYSGPIRRVWIDIAGNIDMGYTGKKDTRGLVSLSQVLHDNRNRIFNSSKRQRIKKIKDNHSTIKWLS
jgi:hypothetical protein